MIRENNIRIHTVHTVAVLKIFKIKIVKIINNSQWPILL